MCDTISFAVMIREANSTFPNDSYDRNSSFPFFLFMLFLFVRHTMVSSLFYVFACNLVVSFASLSRITETNLNSSSGFAVRVKRGWVRRTD
jgi:hypothetical protein